jgi:DNA-binding IclR family transcriptional regulator
LTTSLDATELAQLNEKLAGHAAKLRRLYLSNCDMVRQLGYCECPSMVIEGVINMSSPIHDHAGQVIAALTIPFIRRLTGTNQPTRVQTRKQLIAMSRHVSAMLGGIAGK